MRAANVRSPDTSSGSSTAPEWTPTIVGFSVGHQACAASTDVPALGAAGPVDDATADMSSRCPIERMEVESALMSLYAPRLPRSATGRGTRHAYRRLARQCARPRAIGSEPPPSAQMITGTVWTILGSSREALRAKMVGVSSGGWYVYGPGSVRRRRGAALPFLRGRPFRMIELNVVGWSALLVPPALAGGVSSLAVGRRPTLGALAGAGAACAVAVAWGRWRWWNSAVSVSSDLEPDGVHRVVERLRGEGVEVSLDAADQGSATPPGSEQQSIGCWRLTTRQRWVNRVLASLDEASTAHAHG